MFIQNIFSRSIRSSKKKANLKDDAGYIIKTTVAIIALLGSMMYFAVICRNLINDYFVVLNFTAEPFIPFAIHLCVSALLLVLIIGVIEILVRPVGIVFVSILMASLTFVIVVGFKQYSWLMGFLLFVIISLHFLAVKKQFKNQISFSSFPLANKKMILFLILAIIAGMAFAQGYIKDSKIQSYIIPPNIKAPVVEMIYNQAKLIIESKEGATDEQKKAALIAFRPEAESMVNDWESKLKPYPSTVPWVFGVLFFSVAQMAFFVISLFFGIIISLLFVLLKTTRFANIASEMREVKWLTLQTVKSKSKK